MEIDTQQQTHPNPQPSTHHRKIELQSPLDLTYLQQNLANSALAKLDLHFPPIPPAHEPATVISLDGPVGSKATDSKTQTHNGFADRATQEQTAAEDNDPLRTKVRALISEFLHNTWSNAQHNLTLNGLDASDQPIPRSATLSKPLSSNSTTATDDDLKSTSTATRTQELTPPEREGIDFTYAPFDPRLQQKLASLHGELEKLTSEVSALRRTAPKQGAAIYQSALDEAIQREDTAFEHRRNKARQIKPNSKDDGADSEMQIDNEDEERADDTVVDLSSTIDVRPGWTEDVREIYEHGLQELRSLAGVEIGVGIPSSSQPGNPQGQVSSGLSLTETMGKVQRARTVAMEMD